MTDDSEPKRGRGRPRREGADEEILGVALDLLREQGYRAFSLDTIVERTGIAKTTIYRRWPSKSALVAAALAPLTPAPGAHVDALLREATEVLNLLADSDGDVLDVIRALLATRRPLLRDALAGHEDADQLLGALVVRLLLDGRIEH